jgi:[ribosomal protein S5]-alanine N-acetyltransferase
MLATFAKSLCATPLRTPRLLIERRMAGHAAEMFPHYADEALYRWISMNRPKTADSLEADFLRTETCVSPNGTEGWPSWVVREGSAGPVIGQIDACITPEHLGSNFGYYFFVPFWGRGLATEALRAVADHLLASGVSALHATVTDGNIASCRVLEKIGFAYARRIKDNDTLNGMLVDDLEYVRFHA